ncbi:MAG: hypothetical protein ACOYXT_17380 [Bacteroidota bacterium]
MYSKCWQIVKDDAKKTFEVCGQTSNSNSFENSIRRMQKAGMNVSWDFPPVTNKNSNKEAIKIFNYKNEEGLYLRLMNQYREISKGSADEWSEE